MRQIYLDYNATTPIAPNVQEAMLPYLAEHHGNASSTYLMGRVAHEAVETARSYVASLLGADPDEIVFTSGGSESNNQAIKGVILRDADFGQRHCITSAIEHPAVTEPMRYLQRLGVAVSVVECTRHGVIEPRQLEAALRPETVLVSVMHANNEVGTLQPIREIAEICRSRNLLLHTDASQSVGKVPVRVDELGVDLLTLAGHKLYAPKGIGALYIRRGTPIESLIHGAGHEGGLRAGTENVASVVGLGKACLMVQKHLDEKGEQLIHLRDRLAGRLCESIGAELSINGYQAPRLPNTLSVNFPGVAGVELLAQIPELCASTGSACHSGSAISSPTLKSMGLRPEVASGTVRLSVGWYTTEEEVDRAASLLIEAWEKLRGR